MPAAGVFGGRACMCAAEAEAASLFFLCRASWRSYGNSKGFPESGSDNVGNFNNGSTNVGDWNL
jgi:hypothetical protein